MRIILIGIVLIVLVPCLGPILWLILGMISLIERRVSFLGLVPIVYGIVPRLFCVWGIVVIPIVGLVPIIGMVPYLGLVPILWGMVPYLGLVPIV